MAEPSKVRALSLLSGGLDSQLAICVLRDQGLEVHGLVFESPFFGSTAARRAADQLRVPLHIVDFTDDILGILEAPKHGFGSGMNPCIDCHARMLRRAGEMLAAGGFHFLSTGEVLNERPMSQNRNSLQVVARDSGFADLIVRPLSAQLLPETRPEQLGWVDRSRLLALHGRQRKEQLRLARHYGLTHVPAPAGGCRLTEPNYSKRLKDLREYGQLSDRQALALLRVGRHFRIEGGLKVVVGRNSSDNEVLEHLARSGDILLSPEDVPGPVCWLPPGATLSQIEVAAALCVRYADAPRDVRTRIRVTVSGGAISEVSALPMAPDMVNGMML